MTAEISKLDTQRVSRPKWQTWAGWVLSALPVMMLVMSASMKIAHKPDAVAMFVGKFGWAEGMLPTLAALELACTLVYLVPRTAVLGAVLLTGYLGGAVATHVRVGDVFVAPLLVGVLLWVGLYLRDARVRALLPLRQVAAGGGDAQ